jgi:hypothetical protein
MTDFFAIGKLPAGVNTCVGTIEQDTDADVVKEAPKVRPPQEIIECPSFVIQRIGSEDKIGRTHHYEERWEGEMKFDHKGSWRITQPGICRRTTGK